MRTSIFNNNMYYEEHGNPDGIPIIFIHGLALSMEMWRPQIEALPSDFRGIFYDVRGHGQSEIDTGQYSIEFFVDELEMLMDEVKLDQAILCGLSMGGYIALRAIERIPDQVTGLILCDTKSQSDDDQGRINRAIAVRSIEQMGLKGFTLDFLKAILAEDTHKNNPGLVQQCYDIIIKNDRTGVCGALLALACRTDTTHVLPDIKVPTLIIVGENDGLTTPDMSKDMDKLIPNSELSIIPDAGHMSNLENPEEFNKTLFEFLKKLENP